MRIVHIIEAYGAGTLNAVVLLANRQVTDGHQVAVLHSLRPDTPANHADLFHPAVARQEMAMPRELSPLKDFTAAAELRGVLQVLKPDVVHLHSSKAGAIGRLACAGLHLPVIYSPHGFAFLRQDISPMKRKFFWHIEKLLGRLATRIMACSTAEADDARKLAPAARIFNAVDVADLEAQAKRGRSRIKPNPGVSYVAISGRIALERNPEGFSRVAALVRAQSVTNVEFIWLGDGDRSRLDPSIQVTGWLDKPDLLATLKNVDVYFHPSHWEGLPFALLEAMAMARPVVASCAGGNVDAVRPGKTGYLSNEEAIQAKALTLLLDRPGLGARFGQAGRARAEEAFSLKAYFNDVYTLYADAVQEVARV